MHIYKILEENLLSKSKYLYYKKISLNDLKIENKVKLQCFHCKNYKTKWTCPPNIPDMDYKKFFSEYSNVLLVYCKIPFSSIEEFEIVRRDSTNLVHKTLLEMEKILYDNNESFAVSFIGGSCKLCKDGCSKEKCRLPHLSRIPLEGTGVNVIDLVKKSTDIDIIFPPKEFLYRFGLLLW